MTQQHKSTYKDIHFYNKMKRIKFLPQASRLIKQVIKPLNRLTS